MTGLLALSSDFWSYAVIAIAILAATAIGEKPCRRCFPFPTNRPSSESESLGGEQ
jgi:hypothetical protein